VIEKKMVSSFTMAGRGDCRAGGTEMGGRVADLSRVDQDILNR